MMTWTAPLDNVYGFHAQSGETGFGTVLNVQCIERGKKKKEKGNTCVLWLAYYIQSVQCCHCRRESHEVLLLFV